MYPNIECLGSATEFFDEILANIEHIKLFEDFTEDELKVLCHYMTCYAAPRDYALIEEGDTGDFLLIVLTGEVSVMKMVTANGPQLIRDVGVGASPGELSLIDNRPRYATCITKEPCDFAVLKRDALNEILVHYPRLANKFLLILLQTLTVRMRETSDRFLPIVFSAAL